MATSSCEVVSRATDGTAESIENETFDFDVPISPSEDLRNNNTEVEDEDEVFFGPVGHKERCVAVNSILHDNTSPKPMSPLSGEQIAELFKEATAVSIFIRNSTSNQQEDDDMEINEKENGDIYKILSETVIGSEHKDEKPGIEENITKECVSELTVESNISQNQEVAVNKTSLSPKGVLQENNGQDCFKTTLQSPFKGRKPRPIQSAAKFASSKLPKTQMTLKTRSCFNSPINVNQLYGLSNSSPEESKKPLQDQGAIKPPGIAIQSCRRRRRRTSSSSSVSSTSSASSLQSHDLNETFIVSKEQASGIATVTNICPRQAPATKACLKPTSTSKLTFVKRNEVPKPKGRPKPIRALPQHGNAISGQGKGSQTCTSTTPKTKMESVSTPKVNGLIRRQGSISMSTNQSDTPLKTQKLLEATDTPKTKDTPGRKSNIPTEQSFSRVPTPSKARKSDPILTPRRRGSAASSRSISSVPTPIRRQKSAVEGFRASRNLALNSNQAANYRRMQRPTTPENGVSTSSDTTTPPNAVQSSAASNRKSLSANGPKRRSLLPTPVKSGLKRSQSHSSKKSISDFKAVKAVVPFNISPGAEEKLKGGLVATPQRLRVSDPFSPGIMVPISPVQDSTRENSTITNLIELSPSAPMDQVEEKLIDI